MKKAVPIALVVIGILLALPAVVVTRGLTRDDATVALDPLARIPLDQLETSGSAAVIVTIPNNVQWARIRREWGNPDYLVTAIEYPGTAAELIHCLDQLEIKIEMTEKAGHVALEVAKGWPYGHTATCPAPGLKFRAAPGVDVTIHAVSSRHPMPVGELVLMCDWNNLKDKLVGVSLNEELARPARFATAIGILMVLSGILLGMRRRRGTRRMDTRQPPQ